MDSSLNDDPPRAARALSQRQTLMWFDEQLAPGAPAHRMVLRAKLSGGIDVSRLQAAFATVVAEYDALGLRIEGSELQQTFAPPTGELALVQVADRQAADAWCVQRCLVPWSDTRGSRYHAALLRCTPTEHLLFFCVSHLLSDGGSILAFLRDLESAYTGVAWEPRPGFAVFLDEEAQYLTSPRAREDAAYWDRLLANPPPPLRLYGKSAGPMVSALTRTTAIAPRELAAGLTAIARQPLFKAIAPAVSRLLAMATALCAFLHRASGQRELLLGMPMANRSPRFARTFGLLMTQIYLRTEINPGETFVTLAVKVRAALYEGMRHLRRAVREKELSYVSLNLLPPVPPRFADLAVEFQFDSGLTLVGTNNPVPLAVPAQLGLQFHDVTEGSFAVSFDLPTDQFDEAVRARLTRHFFKILTSLTRDPNQKLETIDLLDNVERDLVLSHARGPEPAGVADALLARLAWRAAPPTQTNGRAQGPTIALETAEGSFTYAEVDRLSSVLAGRLLRLGVARDSRVGVALPRGAREVCALLAAQKAGGCYVPIDLSHPLERIRIILEDAAPDALITFTGSPLAQDLPGRTLLLDDLASLTEPPPPTLPPSDAEQLAYILFTSGSSGRPKGVEISRGAFANFLRSMERQPGARPDDRLLAITTTTFDIAGLELFLPLWVGARVFIADRDTAIDAHKLRALLERETFTMLQATPAMYRLLLDAGWTKGEGMRLLCGGEPMPAPLAARLLATGAELWNMYGPTETTVWSTVERIVDPSAQITIGRPIDHTQVYVLDENRRLVPPGILGELFIGGRGLARGYRGRPELTAERFIADPFGGPGDRIYATGDLARMLDDGRFECLGRADHQVKIRGYRIELGEIESALRDVPGTKEVVVTADTRAGGDPTLVAYWVGSSTSEALFERAKGKLPPYMVPAAFIPLEAFPLNTNGKIDRKNLPAPTASARTGVVGQLARNDDELRMSMLFADVLQLPTIPVDQDFFALGGTSVLALELRRRIEAEFGTALSLAALFENPTVVHLLSKLGQRTDTQHPLVISLRGGDEGRPPLLCLMGVQIYRDLALALDPGVRVYGIHIPTAPPIASTAGVRVEDYARQYAELILERFPQEPYDLMGLCFGGMIAAETGRLLHQLGKRIGSVSILDAALPRGKTYLAKKRGKALVTDMVQQPVSTGLFLGKKANSWLQRRLASVLPVLPVRRPEKIARTVNEAPRSIDPQALFDAENPLVTELIRKYDSQVHPLPFPLTIIRAAQRDDDPWQRAHGDLGWGALTHSLRAVSVPGSHLAILRPPNVDVVARAIGDQLRREQSAERGA